MISCDNCNVIVTKLNFCSDKCRIEHHRDHKTVTPSLQDPKPIKRPKQEVEDVQDDIKLCKHGASVGLCKHGC